MCTSATVGNQQTISTDVVHVSVEKASRRLCNVADESMSKYKRTRSQNCWTCENKTASVNSAQ
jgi:acyl-ACP thioesterase